MVILVSVVHPLNTTLPARPAMPACQAPMSASFSRRLGWFAAATTLLSAIAGAAPFTGAIFLIFLTLPAAAVASLVGAVIPATLTLIFSIAAFAASPMPVATLLEWPLAVAWLSLTSCTVLFGAIRHVASLEMPRCPHCGESLAFLDVRRTVLARGRLLEPPTLSGFLCPHCQGPIEPRRTGLARLVLALGIPFTLAALISVLFLLEPAFFFKHGALSNLAMILAFAAAFYIPFLAAKAIVRYERRRLP